MKKYIWGSALALLLTATVASGQVTKHKALAIGWTGYADTDIKISDLFAGDHTIVTRFMAQYPHGYEGPIISNNTQPTFGSPLFIGLDDYGIAPKKTRLKVAIGSYKASIPVDIDSNQWHQVAISCMKAGDTLNWIIYFDGSLAGSISVKTDYSYLPSGTLRFGKGTPNPYEDPRNAQFYGLVDDVAIFTRHLGAEELHQLAQNPITGFEAGLLAAYTFDQGNLHFKLQRPLTYHGAAETVEVSADGNAAKDVQAIPLPNYQVEMTLPFAPGVAWQVIQGYDSHKSAKSSHNGYAAFCWDFTIADKPQGGIYPNGTGLAPIYAAAPGQVAQVFTYGHSGPDYPVGSNPANHTRILQQPGEYASYLHTPHDYSLVTVGSNVVRGQQVNVAGDTGVDLQAYHLHFGVTDGVDADQGAVTYPIAFTNYEVRGSDGKWTRVAKGIPQLGDVIRNPVVDGRYDAVWRPKVAGDQADPLAQEIQMETVTLPEFKQAYDQLWDMGWRVFELRPVSNGLTWNYDAIWRPGNATETQVYAQPFAAFKAKYDELWPKGWRLYSLQSYVVVGQVLYDAVWRLSTAAEIQNYGATFQFFKSNYDLLWPQGWRLAILQSYVYNGQVLYNAVWRKGTYSETQDYGVTFSTFKSKYDSLWPDGWRLSMLQSYEFQGQTRFNAVWTKIPSPEIQIYNASWEEYRAKYDELHAKGWELEILNRRQ